MDSFNHKASYQHICQLCLSILKPLYIKVYKILKEDIISASIAFAACAMPACKKMWHIKKLLSLMFTIQKINWQKKGSPSIAVDSFFQTSTQFHFIAYNSYFTNLTNSVKSFIYFTPRRRRLHNRQ